MKRIAWSSKLNLGIQKIDDQHKRLVKLVNNLVSAIQSGLADDIIASICHELAEYTAYHFRDEELLMQEIGYPGLEEQKNQHEALSAKVSSYQEAIEQGNHVDPKEVLGFLSEWLVEHFLHSDIKIACYIKEQQSKK